MNTICLEKQLQLETMLTVCKRMDAEITLGFSSDNYFTVACREDWDKDTAHRSAREIQAGIKAFAARFPNIVCFSLDCFCTLIYVV